VNQLTIIPSIFSVIALSFIEFKFFSCFYIFSKIIVTPMVFSYCTWNIATYYINYLL